MIHFILYQVLIQLSDLVSSGLCIYPVQSNRFFTTNDLHNQIVSPYLDGSSIKLVAVSESHFYLGTRSGVFALPTRDARGCRRVATWAPRDGAVQRVHFLNSSRALVCSRAPICREFAIGDRQRCPGCQWQLRAGQLRTGDLGFRLLLADEGRTSLRLNKSIVAFSAYPGFQDTIDLVQLLLPRLRIGFTTADLYSRRNRAFWFSKSSEAFAMATVANRLYTVFTEEALEASNYLGSVNGDTYGTTMQLVKAPRFTRIGRVCLNDPGLRRPGQSSQRVLTSFFKVRLICRNASVDYDVLQLATGFGEDASFYGLFAPQNSPANGFLALCRFRLAAAEARIASGDFLELNRSSWYSYTASRLPRQEFLRRSELSDPAGCSWSRSDQRLLHFSDLYVERMAPLLARPLIGDSLLTLTAATRHVVTVMERHTVTAGAGAGEEILLLGTDNGAVVKLLASAAYVIETLHVLGDSRRVDRLAVRAGALFVFGADKVASLPLCRCGLQRSCRQCVGLRDPGCSWHVASSSCRFASSGLANVSSGTHSACPEAPLGRSLEADTGRGAEFSSVLPQAARDAKAGVATDDDDILEPRISASMTDTGGGVSAAVVVAVLVSVCSAGFVLGFLTGRLLRLRAGLRQRAAADAKLQASARVAVANEYALSPELPACRIRSSRSSASSWRSVSDPGEAPRSGFDSLGDIRDAGDDRLSDWDLI